MLASPGKADNNTVAQWTACWHLFGALWGNIYVVFFTLDFFLKNKRNPLKFFDKIIVNNYLR
jgi:hypothetical protein